jgi:hypothetical protein
MNPVGAIDNSSHALASESLYHREVQFANADDLWRTQIGARLRVAAGGQLSASRIVIAIGDQ